MGLVARTYHELYCDKCNTQFEWWDGMMACRDADQILQLAVDADWWDVDEVGVFCMDCGPPNCSCGHTYGGHDYDTSNGCEDCACERYSTTAPTTVT